jgi:hypothetical protein
MSAMRLSELGIIPPEAIAVTEVWIDGIYYELSDDGDTLIRMPASNERRETTLRLLRETKSGPHL